eukprot:7018339-Pyramimonas_sp.AAC.1
MLACTTAPVYTTVLACTTVRVYTTAPLYTTMLACTAAPVHTTAPVYTSASAWNAALVYTTVPACRDRSKEHVSEDLLRTAKRHAKEVLMIECD